MKMKQIGSEVSTWFKQVFRFKNCWILLPGLLALSLVYAVHYFGISPQLTTKIFHESFAPWLLLIVLLIFLTASFLSRDALVMYLSGLALVFLIRELNATVLTVFGGEYLFKSKKLVDCLLVGMALWAWGWREKLFTCCNRSIALKILISGVLWTYLFSQLIARRVFRDILPEENLLHVPMEETAETAAHVFLLVCALYCLFYYRTRKATQVQACSSSAKPGNAAGEVQDALECGTLPASSIETRSLSLERPFIAP